MTKTSGIESDVKFQFVLYQALLSVWLNAIINKSVSHNHCLIKQTISYVASDAAERLQII